ncbi:unnamed protein product [Prorocentrum cordatum]|uniref:Subtilisin n=1 Tax=Prorocentrum cordatum TaxID=2364126 RepID=A0ABN9U6F1_9DINO|nr:unnamed protein product [Polarella glacialis]
MWAKAHAETVSFVSGLAAGWHLAEREPRLPPGMRCTCGAVVFSAPPVASEVPLATWQTECALAPPPRPALLERRSGSQVGSVAAAAAASDDLLLGALGIVGYDGERESAAATGTTAAPLWTMPRLRLACPRRCFCTSVAAWARPSATTTATTTA